jgi:hypothetical protein
VAFQLLDRSARLPATAAALSGRLSTHDDWWMTDAERLALTALLSDLRPECAIEVGVYRAGSLSILARFCKQVFALDIDPTCAALFRDQFPNVEFVTGDSRHTLPQVLKRLSTAGEPLGFVLIDADHSRDGVQHDIESLLRYTPIRPLYVVMHDSFNPECRRGIKTADWSSSSYVHLVELDFVTGRFAAAEEGDSQREMWCGFALAVLLPEKRDGDVVIHENEQLLQRTAFRASVHRSRSWTNPAHLVHAFQHRLRRVLEERAPRTYAALRYLVRRRAS